MKKRISLILVFLLCFGLLAGCNDKPTETQPTETQAAEVKDDGILKVLLFGNSMGCDAVWMLPEVFTNEAPDTKVVIGFLYHSDCRVAQHISFAQNNMAMYSYCEYDSENDDFWRIALSGGEFEIFNPNGGTLDGSDAANGISQTSKFALRQHDWDIVIAQGHPWEVANISQSTTKADPVNDTRSLFEFVIANDKNTATATKFGWNMVWGFAPDETLIQETDKTVLDANFPSADGITKQSQLHFDKMAAVVNDELMPVLNFDYVIPSATVFHNAYTSYLMPADLHREQSDLGRMMVAYLWYCTLTGTAVEDCKLDPIFWNYRKDISGWLMQENLVLSDSQKKVLTESVANAMKSPYQITQSQYTQEPAQ